MSSNEIQGPIPTVFGLMSNLGEFFMTNISLQLCAIPHSLNQCYHLFTLIVNQLSSTIGYITE